MTALAAELARGSRVVAAVYLREMYSEDSVMGTATVSLAPLLQSLVVDGRAPVLHPTDTEGNPDTEAVAVGDLRIAIKLEARVVGERRDRV